MNRPPEVDVELAAARQALQGRAQVLVLWNRRHAGGLVEAATVRALLPGASAPVRLSNGELAVLRSLELRGELAVVWPFHALLGPPQSEQPHAPLAPEIEAAALALQRQAAERHDQG
jgi:hypothetical protein